MKRSRWKDQEARIKMKGSRCKNGSFILDVHVLENEEMIDGTDVL
jgi:hypothetical protein